MSKTVKELREEILEYQEMIDELTPQLCGDENDEEFEKEIRNYEEIISNNHYDIMNQILRKSYEKEIRETEELILNYQNKRDELQSKLDSIELNLKNLNNNKVVV